MRMKRCRLKRLQLTGVILLAILLAFGSVLMAFAEPITEEGPEEPVQFEPVDPLPDEVDEPEIVGEDLEEQNKEILQQSTSEPEGEPPFLIESASYSGPYKGPAEVELYHHPRNTKCPQNKIDDPPSSGAVHLGEGRYFRYWIENNLLRWEVDEGVIISAVSVKGGVGNAGYHYLYDDPVSSDSGLHANLKWTRKGPKQGWVQEPQGISHFSFCYELAPTYRITGRKFHDIWARGGADQRYNHKDVRGKYAGMNGWTINLYKDMDFDAEPFKTTQTVYDHGGKGFYEFTGLPNGTYYITETMPEDEDWAQVAPGDPYYHEVKIKNGQVNWQRFYNTKPVSFTVQKCWVPYERREELVRYECDNGCQPPPEGMTFEFLLKRWDYSLKQYVEVARQETDSDGYVTFEKDMNGDWLLPGKYILYEVIPEGAKYRLCGVEEMKPLVATEAVEPPEEDPPEEEPAETLVRITKKWMSSGQQRDFKVTNCEIPPDLIIHKKLLTADGAEMESSGLTFYVTLTPVPGPPDGDNGNGIDFRSMDNGVLGPFDIKLGENWLYDIPDGWYIVNEIVNASDPYVLLSIEANEDGWNTFVDEEGNVYVRIGCDWKWDLSTQRAVIYPGDCPPPEVWITNRMKRIPPPDDPGETTTTTTITTGTGGGTPVTTTTVTVEEEPVPLVAPTVTEDPVIILDQPVPLAPPVLPQTGQLPFVLFYLMGAVAAGAGALVKKRH